MENVSFSQQSLKPDSCERSTRGALALQSFDPPSPSALETRLLEECGQLLARRWRGAVRTGASFHMFQLRRSGARVTLAVSADFPNTAPRVFVFQGHNVRWELGKGQLLSLETWASTSTLVDLADEVRLYVEGSW